MQTRDQAAQAQRKPPEGMPTRVPPRRPPRAAPRTGEPLPAQKPVTDEPEIRPPAQWKKVVKRVFAILGLVISLALVYVFLLIGEPDEDEQLAQQVQKQEETIRVPIAAAQVAGTADLNALAVNFGMPVLTLQGETLQSATLFDTAFRGGYARRFQLHYTDASGQTIIAESIRPTAAVSLLAKGSVTLAVDQLYTVAGMDALRIEGEDTTMVLARGTDAAYAIILPKGQEATLTALLKQGMLMQPTAP